MAEVKRKKSTEEDNPMIVELFFVTFPQTADGCWHWIFELNDPSMMGNIPKLLTISFPLVKKKQIYPIHIHPSQVPSVTEGIKVISI